jgi:hypothetical protein
MRKIYYLTTSFILTIAFAQAQTEMVIYENNIDTASAHDEFSMEFALFDLDINQDQSGSDVSDKALSVRSVSQPFVGLADALELNLNEELSTYDSIKAFYSWYSMNTFDFGSSIEVQQLSEQMYTIPGEGGRDKTVFGQIEVTNLINNQIEGAETTVDSAALTFDFSQTQNLGTIITLLSLDVQNVMFSIDQSCQSPDWNQAVDCYCQTETDPQGCQNSLSFPPMLTEQVLSLDNIKVVGYKNVTSLPEYDQSKSKTLLGAYNTRGQKIDRDTKNEVMIYHYSDGSREKVFIRP